MKNNEIIEKLNIDNKLSLIADGKSVAGDELSSYGIPKIKVASLSDINKKSGTFPSDCTLANSWNKALISRVANSIATKAKADGVNVVFTYPVHVKSNPYVCGISEDPFFVKAFAKSQVEGIKSAKVMPCLYCLPMVEGDIKYLDDNIDERVLNEYFFSPFKLLSENTTNVVITPYSYLYGDYEQVNTNLFFEFLHEHLSEDNYILANNVDDELCVESVMMGVTMSFFGNISPLRTAVENYNHLKEGIDKGEYPEDELDASVADGSAISVKTIDCAVDKAIEFAKYCSIADAGEGTINATDDDGLALNAFRESIVLLKNNGVLPLKAGKPVAVIGELAEKKFTPDASSFLETVREAKEFNLVGYARGYDSTKVRCDDLIDEASKLAEGADTVLLFIGFTDATKNKIAKSGSVKLPANQLALIDALEKTGKNIIAIIDGCEYSVDMSFDNNISAVLIDELGSSLSARALIEVLVGKISPSGRLTQAYYDDTDSLFDEIVNNKDAGKNKVGVFLGYRYFDSSKIAVKYPFGFGLSYANFEYKNLEVKNGSVSVQVKNASRVAGCEVVQLYVAKQTSAIIRCEKELKNFEKVYLEAGETKTINMALTPDMLTVYDKKTDRDVVEDGDYTIMIASSSQLKLQTTFNIKGEVIPDSNEKVSDYLQSETNIQEKGYMLGDIKKPSHKGKKVKVIGIVMLVISIILVALIGILHFGGIISISTQVGWQVALGLSIGLVILSLGVVIVAHFVAKSAKDEGEVLVKSATSDSSPEDQKSYERLFEEQFGNEDKKKPTAKVEVKDTSSDETDILRFVDSTITADVLCNRLSTFATERGLAVDANTSRKIISALCASRLLFLRGEKETSGKLLSILGEFFGGKNYLSTMEHCENIDSLFYTVNESGAKSKTQFAVAIEEAKNVQQNAYFSAIEGVATEDINTMFLPFIKYINNPYGNYSVFCGGEKIDLPSNLWFVVILDKNSQIKKVDSSILDCANILNHNIKLVEEKEEKTAIKPISCYQLVKLTTDAFENDFLDETWWKKVDAIEEYFNSISPFHISNKKCQRLEKYSSVFILSGGEAVEAVDNMLASEVLFTAMRITDGKKSEISVVLKEQLENILGEDSCSECKNAISIYEAQA